MIWLMTCAYLLAAAGAASAFYLATSHQRVWQPRAPLVRALRLGGCGVFALSLVCAIAVLGPWAGIFAALTTLMLAAIVLPCVDMWRHARAQRRQVLHVG
ncbi:hypothetical protein [Xanthomonas vesicatoria]|uniref:hypothetical protein n=1 Tax=Xanthomonas vesicatoria TaxID=56460 RepID=UPI001E3E0241|nr:hypothetical protein [Xanthomonas vesicatoria]MCC8620387.1 hypothetical protein [Xanthomonas vesicatoria]MCC8631948.1 hypothetical protein [Xanthomonas vesicatoria]